MAFFCSSCWNRVPCNAEVTHEKKYFKKHILPPPSAPWFDSVRISLIVSHPRKSKHEHAVSYHPLGEGSNAKSRVAVLVNCKVFVVHVLETPKRVGISFQKNPAP